MISIFSKFDHTTMSTVKNNKVSYVRDRLEREIHDTIDYYRYRSGKVKNSNMLVRLITTAAPDYHKDIFDFIRVLDSTAVYHSKTFDMSSSINKGRILDSVIFGHNSLELFIYQENELDIMGLEDNWRELNPIEVIRYSGTDTSLVMPSDKIHFDFPTLSIFKLDVRMMMVQYKYWSLERLSKDFGTDPAEFIYSQVFPNMIRSIMDLTIINRLIHINNGTEMQDNRPMHPFNILDLNRNIDAILKDTIKYVKGENKHYTNIMKNIYLINKDTMYDIMFEPDIGNRQNKWALFLSKLPYIMLLINLSSTKTFKRNKDTVNELKILIKILERERALEHVDNDFIEVELGMNIELLKEQLEEI